MDVNRRKVIALATAVPVGSALAQSGSSPSELGPKIEAWSKSLRPHLEKLDEKQLETLMKRNGVTNVDELALSLSTRYPKIKPSDTMGKFDAKLINPILADQGTYEKSPSHDKEPYDKSPGYDRGGFSRTYEKYGDILKFSTPGQKTKSYGKDILSDVFPMKK